MKINYTEAELCQEIEILRHTFDFAAMVDPLQCLTLQSPSIAKDRRLCPSSACFGKAGSKFRCLNCISMRAALHQSTYMKFDISLTGEIFYMISRYVEVDSHPSILAAGKEITKDMPYLCGLPDAFRATVRETNLKLMTDPLTSAFNQLFIQEHFESIARVAALLHTPLNTALLRINRLHAIRDTYGQAAENGVLRSIFTCIEEHFPPDDSEQGCLIARAADDCFLIMDRKHPFSLFSETILKTVDSIPALSVLYNGIILRFTASHVCFDYAAEDYAASFDFIRKAYGQLDDQPAEV